MKPSSFFVVREFLWWYVFLVFSIAFPFLLWVTMIDDLLVLLFCSFPVSLFKEEVPVSHWESKGVSWVRQGFWRTCFSSVLIFTLFGSRTVYKGSEEFGSCEKEYVFFLPSSFSLFFIFLFFYFLLFPCPFRNDD